MKGTSRLISSGPTTSESMPSSLFTSARQRIVRKRAVVVGEGEMAALGEHDVEIEVRRERLVEPNRAVVETHAFGSQVVGADDGGVAARAAATDVALVDHGHAPNAVVGRQVVRRRETVHPGADDHDVVGPFQSAGFARPWASPAWSSRAGASPAAEYRWAGELCPLPVRLPLPALPFTDVHRALAPSATRRRPWLSALRSTHLAPFSIDADRCQANRARKLCPLQVDWPSAASLRRTRSHPSLKLRAAVCTALTAQTASGRP